jgi:hypothetical protein
MCLHQARRLGFCQQAPPRAEAILGTGDPAQISSTGCATTRNPEMHRLAHVSSHVFDAFEKRGYGIQSHAGTLAAFNSAINLGCVYPGFSRSWKAAVGCKSRCAITSPRFSLGLLISRFGAFQTLLPQCGLPGKHRLKRPEHWHDGILATTTRSRSLGHYSCWTTIRPECCVPHSTTSFVDPLLPIVRAARSWWAIGALP